jgi:hypothetical protein
LKDSRFSKMDVNLIAKAVLVISALSVIPLGFGLSSLLSLSTITHDPTIVSVVFWKTPPMRSIFRMGFPGRVPLLGLWLFA